MTEEELLSAIQTELDNSCTAEGSHFQQAHGAAENYYKLHAARIEDKAKGRSKARSPDIQAMTDQTIAQIMPRFRRNEILAQYAPKSADDAEQAQAESEGINKIVLHDSDGYTVIRGALFDAILSGLCAAVVYWDASQQATIETYPDELGLLTDETVGPLLQSRPDETITIINREEGGVTVRRLAPRGELCIKPIPLKFIRLAGDGDCVNADKLNFVGYESYASVDELVGMGVPYETAITLPDAGDEHIPYGNDQARQTGTHVQGHESTQNKELNEIWYKVDFDGDGRAERRHIRYSGDVILHNEEVSDAVDIVLGTGLHQPHLAYGWSFYHKLQQTQDIKTEVLQQAIDSGRIAIDNRWLAEEQALDMDSMTHSRPGGIVIARPGMFDKVMPLNNQNNFDSALNLLNYQDKIRSETGGNALDMAGENSPVPGSTAHGVERIITSREQFVAEISETFSQTFLKQLFVVAHRVLRRHGAPVQVTINEQSATVSASQFPERNEVQVDLGPTKAQQVQMQQALQMTVERQLQPEVQGLGIVDSQRVYETLVDLAEAYELPAPDKYWLNPSSTEGGIQQENMQLKQQMAEMGMQLQQMQAYIGQFQQAQLELEAAKLKQKNDEAMAKLDYEYAKLGEETDIKEEQVDLDAEELDLKAEELEMKYDEQITRNES